MGDDDPPTYQFGGVHACHDLVRSASLSFFRPNRIADVLEPLDIEDDAYSDLCSLFEDHDWCESFRMAEIIRLRMI